MLLKLVGHAQVNRQQVSAGNRLIEDKVASAICVDGSRLQVARLGPKKIACFEVYHIGIPAAVINFNLDAASCSITERAVIVIGGAGDIFSKTVVIADTRFRK